MRKYGVLTDNGNCLYLYEKLEDMVTSQFDECSDGLGSSDQLIEINSYRVLAVGPTVKMENQ